MAEPTNVPSFLPTRLYLLLYSTYWYTIPHLGLIHFTAFSSCVCGRRLHFCREIENFLSLHWHSPLWKMQTAVSSVNQHLYSSHLRHDFSLIHPCRTSQTNLTTWAVYLPQTHQILRVVVVAQLVEQSLPIPRGPWFKSSHRQKLILYWTFVYCQLCI